MTIQFRCSNKWLKFINDVNCDSHKETVTRVSNWAACHQESSEQMPSALTTSILLPLINESINSPAMVKHCMVVLQKTIQEINPSQVMVKQTCVCIAEIDPVEISQHIRRR